MTRLKPSTRLGVAASTCVAAGSVAAAALAGRAAERRGWDGPSAALACGALLSNGGLAPAASVAYDECWRLVLPASLALTLLGQDAEGAAPRAAYRGVGLAFCAGAAASAAGGLAAARVGRRFAALGDAGAAGGAACLAASFVGGSANFFQVAEAVGLGASAAGRALLSALAAADVVLMAAYFLALNALAGGGEQRAPTAPTRAPTATERAAVVAVAAACVAATLRLAPSARTAALAAAAVAARRAVDGPGRRAAARSAAGHALRCFYASLGLSAPLRLVASAGLPAFALAGTALAVHAVGLAAAARLAGWSRDDALVASNACIGGPSTAAAFAQAAGLESRVLPAVAFGTAGYAAGTGLGVSLYGALRGP